ncbi:hypothetical protein J7E73_07795 [Paenibacillus albidus]|uniref:hypothetical protein n=1 Tax=Paenibacillus albidus TaxID=2041023 RepID=UPI001BEA151C|nr:hypothetical protein [Paenibacillus albidus]
MFQTWLATVSFEALVQVIRQQFDEQVDLIGFNGARRRAIPSMIQANLPSLPQ